MTAPTLFWFRQDLRLADNPGLAAAVAAGRPVLPVYVLDESSPGRWRPGGASRWWLHHSLAALSAAIAEKGAPLILRRGAAAEAIPALVAETGATELHWNRCYEPFAIERDRALKQALSSAGITVASHNAALIAEPWTMRTKAGEPYKVFTPFWRALRAERAPPPPLPAPAALAAPARLPASDALDSWGLLPRRPDWAGGLRQAWRPGEAGARERLAVFVDRVAQYGAARDRPAGDGTSRLSPHLHWGEVGPRQAWHAALAAAAAGGDEGSAEAFLRELGWREFAHHLLYHWPGLPERPWRPAFGSFPWATDASALAAWQRGATGYPIVDAGMRQLWQTGWMHNRVRMIAASFLVKDLLIDWRRGQDWFWDTLVDADLANNAAGWQWVAGSGADAAPYFRVFNPVLQGRKFDPDGSYVRRYVPELARLPETWIHEPWAAPPEILAAAGVALGRDYPQPLVEHGAARDRALAAYRATGAGA
jgi:deoxyribodipyrimidine photo-lyase